MSGEFSRAGAQKALDAVSGRATQTAQTTYLALCSTAPADNTLGTEITTAGYARQAVTWSAPSAADPPETHGTTQLTFGPFTADPPNVTHCMLMDAASGGTVANMLMWWALDVAKDAAVNESIQVAATTGLTMTAS